MWPSCIASQEGLVGEVLCAQAEQPKVSPGFEIAYDPLLAFTLGRREAAIAYDICKLKVATEHGLDTQVNLPVPTHMRASSHKHLSKAC